MLRAYLLGILEARLGDPDSARARARELEAWNGLGGNPGHGPEFAAGVRAEAALAEGDSPRALAALEAAPDRACYIDALQSHFYSHSPERFLRAQLLEAAGRTEEAMGWYSSLNETSPFDLVLQGPAMVRAGRLLEESGRLEEASRAYQEAARLLEGCEPEFDGMAEQARAGFERTVTG